jgi:hypothetical protein
MARGGIPITTIATMLGCSRHTVYKALAQTWGGPVGHRAIAPEEGYHFYNTFTLSLRRRYDFPHPIGHTFLRFLPVRTRTMTGLTMELSRATIASPSHHEEESSLCKGTRNACLGQSGVSLLPVQRPWTCSSSRAPVTLSPLLMRIGTGRILPPGPCVQQACGAAPGLVATVRRAGHAMRWQPSKIPHATRAEATSPKASIHTGAAMA